VAVSTGLRWRLQSASSGDYLRPVHLCSRNFFKSCFLHSLQQFRTVWVHASVGRLIASESQRARDPQHESTVGDTPGSLRSDPAGIMISRPLRVACGSGEPQLRQKEVEKLWALGRSKRATLSLPDNHRKADGETYAFAANALPVALRQREQWHFTNLRNGRSASNSTSPQRHSPRTDIFHPISPIKHTATVFGLGVLCKNQADRVKKP
jgi:hypothetical protein